MEEHRQRGAPTSATPPYNTGDSQPQQHVGVDSATPETRAFLQHMHEHGRDVENTVFGSRNVRQIDLNRVPC